MATSLRQNSLIDLSSYAQFLTPTDPTSNKFECPVCKGKNLSLNPKDGSVYTCFSNQCDRGEIRRAVLALAGEGTPAAQPKAIAQARTVVPEAEKKILGKQEFVYTDVQGNLRIKVIRTNYLQNGESRKEILQKYFNSQTQKWVWPKTDLGRIKEEHQKAVTIYRFGEVMEAVSRGEPIFWTEGEKCADALWKLGIPSTTTIGGSGAFHSYGNYAQVLQGAKLVLCPDADAPGIRYMDQVSQLYPDAQWLYTFPDDPAWQGEAGSGRDVADWIEDGATQEQILAAVGERKEIEVPTKQSPSGKHSKVTPIRPGVQLSGETLLEKIDELLDREATGSSLTAQLSDLAQQAGRQVRDLRELYRQREQERETVETREERKSEIEHLQRIAESRIDLDYFLDSAIASIIKRKYYLLGVPEAAALATLFPVVGSLCRIGTRLMLSRATDFVARPIVYSCLVAESGSNKSAAMRIITDPLTRQLQAEAHNKFLNEKADYEAELEAWQSADRKSRGEKPKQPSERHYYVSDFTPEAIALIQSEQPNHGFLNYQDELSAIINGRGKYTKGRGTEKESLLSGKDGSGIKANRASGKSLYVAETSMSIVGSTQPDTLKQMMGDFSDGAGEWARFLFMHIPLQAQPQPTDDVSLDVSDWLLEVYTRVGEYPAKEYALSPEAAKLYWNWHQVLDEKRLSEPRQALRAVYAKMKGDTGSLALLFHVLNSALRGENEPSSQIGEKDMRRAIAYIKFAINNIVQIHTMGAGGKDNQTALLQKIIGLSNRKGLLSASDVRNFLHYKESADNVRGLFQDLEAMGIGQTQGAGRNLKWSIAQETQPSEISDMGSDPSQEPEPVLAQETISTTGTQEPVQEPEPETERLTRCDGTIFEVGERVNLLASVELSADPNDWSWVNIRGLKILGFVDGCAKLEILEKPHPLEMLQKRHEGKGCGS